MYISNLFIFDILDTYNSVKGPNIFETDIACDGGTLSTIKSYFNPSLKCLVLLKLIASLLTMRGTYFLSVELFELFDAVSIFNVAIKGPSSKKNSFSTFCPQIDTEQCQSLVPRPWIVLTVCTIHVSSRLNTFHHHFST